MHWWLLLCISVSDEMMEQHFIDRMGFVGFSRAYAIGYQMYNLIHCFEHSHYFPHIADTHTFSDNYIDCLLSWHSRGQVRTFYLIVMRTNLDYIPIIKLIQMSDDNRLTSVLSTMSNGSKLFEPINIPMEFVPYIFLRLISNWASELSLEHAFFIILCEIYW